ncbi:MAG: hypothetical protein ABW032_01400 [Burkholderiaceae bacterium]
MFANDISVAGGERLVLRPGGCSKLEPPEFVKDALRRALYAPSEDTAPGGIGSGIFFAAPA